MWVRYELILMLLTAPHVLFCFLSLPPFNILFSNSKLEKNGHATIYLVKFTLLFNKFVLLVCHSDQKTRGQKLMMENLGQATTQAIFTLSGYSVPRDGVVVAYKKSDTGYKGRAKNR